MRVRDYSVSGIIKRKELMKEIQVEAVHSW